eukprot:763140-Hanusia_phi.AAC.1
MHFSTALSAGRDDIPVLLTRGTKRSRGSHLGKLRARGRGLGTGTSTTRSTRSSKVGAGGGLSGLVNLVAEVPKGQRRLRAEGSLPSPACQSSFSNQSQVTESGYLGILGARVVIPRTRQNVPAAGCSAECRGLPPQRVLTAQSLLQFPAQSEAIFLSARRASLPIIQ